MDKEDKAAQPTVMARYERLVSDREPFLDRARKCSELTIPTLIPPAARSNSTIYHTPWQGIGAQGVNTLASKLLMSLFPPNSPCFRYQLDDFTLEKLAQQEGARAKAEEGLNRIERAVQTEMEGEGVRAPLFAAVKHLIIGGNVLIYLPPDKGLRVFGLDSYVVSRTPRGEVSEGIIKEDVDPGELEPEVLALLGNDPLKYPKANDNDKGDKTLELYTRFWRDGKRWRLVQEINGKTIPGSEGSWPLDKTPMLFLRWVTEEGSNYGRSHVEEYLGDLISLEGLSQSIVEAAAAAAKFIVLLSPNASLKAKALTEAENGDVVIGNKDDVHIIQSEKQADLRIAYEAARNISERLAKAFLMTSSVRRDAERVTAEEIRLMASELEDTLGGVYSVMAQEFQLPLVIRIIDRMEKADRLPKLPKDVAKPTIVTGMEALGRGHDLTRYQGFMQFLAPFPPEILQKYINFGDLIKRVGTSFMIDMKGLVRSDEEVAQMEQAAQQQMQQQQMLELAGKAVGPGINAVSQQITNQAGNNNQNG